MKVQSERSEIQPKINSGLKVKRNCLKPKMEDAIRGKRD